MRLKIVETVRNITKRKYIQRRPKINNFETDIHKKINNPNYY